MKTSFLKNKIIRTALSPHDYYCIGYAGKGGYLTALIMSIGVFKKKFIHLGSKIFDSILAYDRAEILDTYIGQINMEIVSSFCGPEGLIWGYDIARETGFKISSALNGDIIKRFKKRGVEIENGENLRRASQMLFGNRNKKHFPLLPGTIVPCAGRFSIGEGPTFLYAASAIGIPENRDKSACVLMEDVGELKKINQKTKKEVLIDGILSVLEIGKNHNIIYKKIFVDFLVKKINSDEIGCALIAMPYFKLAKKAFNKNLTTQTLQQWVKLSKKISSID